MVQIFWLKFSAQIHLMIPLLYFRDSHFMIGEEVEPKPDEQEKPVDDSTPYVTHIVVGENKGEIFI